LAASGWESAVGPLSVEEILAEEAAAIHHTDHRRGQLLSGLNALRTEQTSEDYRANKDADARSGADEDPAWAQQRKRFYCDLNNIGRAALCCSGGGIRSATFCLGVIQALAMIAQPKPQAGTGAAAPTTAVKANSAEESLLSRFHYLSTVSGGGYIGSWLSAWRHRNDFDTVWKNLASRPEGPDVEPPEISWLRAYSNYLTPKVGLVSADTWSAIAIYLRNLILNWLVIVPAVAAVILILKLIITLSVGEARIYTVWWPHLAVALVGMALLVVALAYTTSHRPTRRLPPGADTRNDPNNISRRAFLRRDLPFSLLSAICLTSALTSFFGTELARGFGTSGAIGIGAVLGVLIYAAGWLVSRPIYGKCKDFGCWAVSGLIYGGLVSFGAYLYASLMPYMGGNADQRVWMILLPVILGPPWVLVSQLFADIVFVGLVSYELNSDADREWLGRAAGWIIATAVVWMLTTFITFAGGYLLIDAKQWLGEYVVAAGGVSGVLTAWLGKGSAIPLKPNSDERNIKTIALNVGLAIVGPIFAAILVVGISVGLDLLLLGDSLLGGLATMMLGTLYILGWLAIGFVVAFFIAWVASRCVQINRFSIHALYRNRLVRAYLGASRQQRCPDRFTGFDAEDNLPAHKLWPPEPPKSGSNTFCLFHVVNITLNVVKTARLAWQQRKAESFTVSALHCGAAYKGYRQSIEYGGHRPYGLSLGTAMAISGAAASPNMGYHSSPSVTLLLALFNVRLGWWLGNPGKEGNDTYSEEGPSTAIRPLAEETFGLTTDSKPWVYLSDGGHFENLGLYEMVRRRCRFIVAIDAGCDPDFSFADLGNAVRKIYIDLGIRVRFDDLDQLKNRPKNTKGGLIPYHAIGTIHYADADADGDTTKCKDGVIIYIKPAIHGDSTVEGAGIRSYAAAHKDFPHEPTADQWFSESQFESYRSLGLDIAHNIFLGDIVLGPGGKKLSEWLDELAPTRHP
jgi:NADH:ubiquinone oxidoreductase subunit 6 (subunit J)